MSRVGLVPVTTVTGIETTYEVPYVGVNVAVVVVVVRAALATSAIVFGFHRLLLVTAETAVTQVTVVTVPTARLLETVAEIEFLNP